MDPLIRKFGLALIVTAIGVFSCNSAHAQRFDKLFEEPEDRPVVTLLSAEFLAQKSPVSNNQDPIEMIGLIEPVDETVMYSSQTPSTYTECVTTECGPACQATQCESRGFSDRIDGYRKRRYFSRNRTTKGTLYPVIRPYNQPGFGYYETCWKKINPNPCFCQPGQGASLSSSADDQFLLPIPAEANPAPSYDR